MTGPTLTTWINCCYYYYYKIFFVLEFLQSCHRVSISILMFILFLFSEFNFVKLLLRFVSRHVAFPVFTGIPVFWKFFARKSIFYEIHVKTRRKSGKTYYLHLFIKKRRSWRRDYLFCINRTKEIKLFTEITRCVSEPEKWSDLFIK